MSRRVIRAVLCCEDEVMEPEGPAGHRHAEGCRGVDPRPRLACCNGRVGTGHQARCQAREPALAVPG